MRSCLRELSPDSHPPRSRTRVAQEGSETLMLGGKVTKYVEYWWLCDCGRREGGGYGDGILYGTRKQANAALKAHQKEHA